MIGEYLKAGFPALFVITQEPARAEQVLAHDGAGWRYAAWDCIRGLRDLGEGQGSQEVTDPVEAVRFLDSARDTVLIAHNLHLFLDSPELVQALQNGAERWKALGSCLVVVAPYVHLKPELEKVFTVLDLPLPDEAVLFAMQQELGESVGVEPDRTAAAAAQGLTEAEAEAAFALSLVREKRFSGRVVSRIKAQTLRKSGLLQLWEPAEVDHVGGLGLLKAFLANRLDALKTRDPRLPRLRSLLLVGIPGCGKSLSCKAAAALLDWPLIRLDVGALKASLVGESERRMREATRVIDSFGNAVVWLDEVEKAFAGARSSGVSDGGTSAGMLGHWLTWMQEGKGTALVMATANDIAGLPPEFLRAGRWDALFFVDLPGRTERVEILAIMNEKYGTAIPPEYADLLDGFSGAEIEQLVRDSVFDGLETARAAIVPLSRAMREEIQALREWAKARARLANTQEIVAQAAPRKLRTLN